jgi:transcriptional antiterminator RfaH
MIGDRQRWYVVQSQPNAELKALAHLNRQGFATYLPRYMKRRRHARRVEYVPAPLFPRYLFVGIDIAAQRWRSVFSTVGVSRLVCNGEMPTPIADEIINALKTREDESGLVRLQLRPNFRAGDAVRVLDGVFADCLGLYEGMRDSDRVAILLDLLGRKVRVTVDVDAVAAA